MWYFLFWLLIMLLTGLMVFLTDKRHPLYLQERVGRNLQLFRLIKFRTMTAPKRSGQGEFGGGDTCCVTCIGRVLRAAKMDKLPELFNGTGRLFHPTNSYWRKAMFERVLYKRTWVSL